MDPNQIGQRVILPASFSGGPRDMMQKYRDGMAIIRKRGKADAFITMTANPRWKEVHDALLPGQTAADCSDIVTRVFNVKLKQRMQDLRTEGVLGRIVGYMCVIEFQKRGLTHAQILIIFADHDKLKTPDDYDDLICAEIPNLQKDPDLYEIILNCNMNGPCGSLNPNCPSMHEGGCKNKYPKEFREETMDNKYGYIVLRTQQWLHGTYPFSNHFGQWMACTIQPCFVTALQMPYRCGILRFRAEAGSDTNCLHCSNFDPFPQFQRFCLQIQENSEIILVNNHRMEDLTFFVWTSTPAVPLGCIIALGNESMYVNGCICFGHESLEAGEALVEVKWKWMWLR